MSRSQDTYHTSSTAPRLTAPAQLGPHACRTIHAYTEGSCSTDSAGGTLLGWSCVLLAEDGDGNLFFVEWLAALADHDITMLDARKDFFSNAAELLAITWAMAWAMSPPLQSHLLIHSDSTYAVGVAHLGPHQRHAHALAHCLAGVAVAARLARPTSCSHAHGHDWQPGTSSRMVSPRTRRPPDWRATHPIVHTFSL